MNVSGILRSSYNITNQMNSYKASIEKSNEKLSTGKRVNSASDSPVDMARISRLDSDIRCGRVVQKNIQDGISMLQTMDTALSNTIDIGQKLKELSLEYQSETNSKEDKAIIEEEAKELIKSLQDTLKGTKFNGIDLFSKENISIRTGINPSDKYDIKMPTFNTISVVTKEERVEKVEDAGGITSSSKTYDMDIKGFSMENGLSVKGEITIDFQEDSDESRFHINYEGQKHEGILRFKNKNMADFEVEWFGNKLEGKLKLNEESDSSNLVGVNTFKLDESSQGWDYTISLSEKKQEGETIDHETTHNISLLNIREERIEDVLSGDYIDKNILKPLSDSRTQVGIQERSLEGRLKMEIQKEGLNSKVLSRIEDLDMAKEMMEKAKNQMLLETNISIFSENLDNHRNYILQLLR